MPRERQTTRDIAAEVMDQGRRTLVPILAELLRRDGISTVDGGEERRLFWTRALTPAEEQAAWNEVLATAGATLPLAPEQVLPLALEVSKRVYPQRWDAARGGGRQAPSEIARWAHHHAKQGPPAEPDLLEGG